MITGIEIEVVGEPELKRIERPNLPTEDLAPQLVEEVVNYLHQNFERELKFVRVTDTEQALGTGISVAGVITGPLIDTAARILLSYLAIQFSEEEGNTDG